MRLPLFCALLLAGLSSVALGQARSTPAASPSPLDQSRQGLWRCELPGGTYEVAIRSVVSVSSHEYVVDAGARVTEVNVDTTGTTVVRFYFLEPLTPSMPNGIGQSAVDRVKELAKEASGRVGADQLWQRVTKNYPATTHAHTVEYRLETKEQLDKLFVSVEKAFRTGQGSVLKLP